MDKGGLSFVSSQLGVPDATLDPTFLRRWTQDTLDRSVTVSLLVAVVVR